MDDNFLKNVLPQKFAFQSPIMNYLLKNSNAVWKLYQTCKYFYLKCHPFIADNLFIGNNKIRTTLHGEGITIDEFIAHTDNKFILIRDRFLFASSDNELIEKLSEKILCSKEASFDNFLDLSFEAFKKLVKHAKIFYLFTTKLLLKDGTFAQMEDILSCIPDADFIYIHDSCYVSSKTEKMLPLIERKQKFSSLNIFDIEGDMNTDKIYEFIIKHKQPKAYVQLSFKGH